MSPKEPRGRKPFTGFIAYYANGRLIKERESFFSKKLNKDLATNWAEIDKEQLISLELVWRDEPKARIDKKPSSSGFNKSKEIAPANWFFSQKGYMNMGTRKIQVVARNIGYIDDGIINIISVVEETGVVLISRRKA
jgi:hypothetical protein